MEIKDLKSQVNSYTYLRPGVKLKEALFSYLDVVRPRLSTTGAEGWEWSSCYQDLLDLTECCERRGRY